MFNEIKSAATARQSVLVVSLGILTVIAVVASQYYIGARNHSVQQAAMNAPTLTVPPQPMPEYTTLAVIGDSYSIPNKTTSEWPRKLAYHHGWALQNFSIGGVGYVQHNSAKGKEPFPVLAGRAIERNPDVVIIAGGRNDVSVPHQVAEAARSTYATLKEQLPEARIVVIGMIHDNRAPTPTAVTVNDTIRREAEAAGLTFIDPLIANWLSDPALFQADGMHPTAEGHTVLFQKINEQLVSAGVI